MESKGNTYTKEDLDLIKLVGKGSYGEVYQANDKKKNRVVAVKILKLDENWLPLLQEINMVIDMADSTIVNYYGWFFDKADMWIIMEYCDGGSLSDIYHITHKPLTEKQIGAVMVGVLRSLSYVHSLNRVHRDIKGGNILATSEGSVKLCDFGVSAQLDDAIGRTGTRIGSPYWMAPEVITGDGHNTKADIWSLGITALELYLSEPPLARLSPLAVLMKIPKDPAPEAPSGASDLFRNFIRKMLIKDPEQRPTADDLLEDPFVKRYSKDSKETIRDMIAQYQEEKRKQDEADEEEDEEEEEEEEDDGEDGGFAMPDDNELTSTLLFNSSTFIASDSPAPDGTCVISTDSSQQSSGLKNWQMNFVDSPNPAPAGIQAKPKKRFDHFSKADLDTMLDRLRKIAVDQLADPQCSVSPGVIRSNYEDCRTNIIISMRKHQPSIPDDYMILTK